MLATYYKAFNSKMECRGKQYQEGVTYEENTDSGVPVLCKKGSMHFCCDPKLITAYHPILDDYCNPFVTASVSPEGLVASNGLKSCTNKLHIDRIIPLREYIDICCKSKFNYINTVSDNVMFVSYDDANGSLMSNYDKAIIMSQLFNAKISTLGAYSKILSSSDNCKISSIGHGTDIISIGENSRIHALGSESSVYVKGSHSIVYIDTTQYGYTKVFLAGNNCECCINHGNYIRGCIGSVFYIKYGKGDFKKVTVKVDSEMKPNEMYYIEENGTLEAVLFDGCEL